MPVVLHASLLGTLADRAARTHYGQVADVSHRRRGQPYCCLYA